MGQGGFTLIELTVVVCMVAFLMATSVKYYQEVMQEARKSGFELLSSRFTTVVSMLHVKWITDKQPASLWLDEETEVLMSARGWPIGASAPYIEKDVGACQQLWLGLFRNSGPLQGESEADEAQFRARRPEKGVCRFEQQISEGEVYYFDYFSSSGRVEAFLN